VDQSTIIQIGGDADRGEIEMGFTALGQVSVVVGQAAVPTEPGLAAFYPPADRQEEEAHLLGQLADHQRAPLY